MTWRAMAVSFPRSCIPMHMQDRMAQIPFDSCESVFKLRFGCTPSRTCLASAASGLHMFDLPLTARWHIHRFSGASDIDVARSSSPTRSYSVRVGVASQDVEHKPARGSWPSAELGCLRDACDAPARDVKFIGTACTDRTSTFGVSHAYV